MDITTFLSILTIIAQIFIALAVLNFIFFRDKNISFFRFFSRNGLVFAFITALVATSGSLYYSEIAGFEPCVLCWYQRIFMYPQVILLAVALLKKDKFIIPYSLALSVVGGLISAYHYLMQLGIVESSSCSVVGYSVSCVKLFFMNFGYITIPLMALTAFLSIIVFLALLKFHSQDQ